MERSVEDNDLGDGRKHLRDGTDAEKVGRIVERGEIAAYFYLAEHVLIDYGAAGEIIGALHYSVAHRLDVVETLQDSVDGIDKRIENEFHSHLMVRNFGKAYFFDQALGQKFIDFFVLHVKQLILDGRTSAIDYKNYHFSIFEKHTNLRKDCVFCEKSGEMIEAEGIEGISFSFTAGVALSAVLGFGPGTVATLALCFVPVIMWLYSRTEHLNAAACLAGFALLGVFCHSSQQWPSAGTGLMEGPLSRLCSFIDGAGFRHESSAALVKALLTGVRDSLSPEIKQAFRESGASHILALSGMHLGVIYGILSKITAPAGNSPVARRMRSLAVTSACGFYTLLTGAGPSVVRAFIFICLNEFARNHAERKRDPAKIYCTALLIQLCVSPGSIASASFQLSYLAMAGIILVYPRLKGLMKGPVWSSMAMSVSCQLFTAPLAWLRFRTFPRYFLLSNLLALPLSEAVIASAVLTLTLQAAGICPDILVECTDKLCQILVFCLETVSSM